MTLSNNHFFISLFGQGSGVLIFTFKKIKIELNIKHSLYDWEGVPLTIWEKESFKDKTVFFNWIPMPFGCVGWRINFFIYH